MGLPEVIHSLNGSSRHRFSTSQIVLLTWTVIITLIAVFPGAQRFDRLPFYWGSRTTDLTSSQQASLQHGLQKCSDIANAQIGNVHSSGSRINPRWLSSDGGNDTVLLKNATLFDGEKFISGTVDILFEKGVIVSVTPSSKEQTLHYRKVVDVKGGYVTPGLVDMHSHHYIGSWPQLPATDDVNEMHPSTGPLTSFLRVIDGLKPGDVSANLIASGGVTSSLILPGSANIIGGEAILVKNAPRDGFDGEELVEGILLEYGIPSTHRKRFMKMAWGENPKGVYEHTRMANSWILRHHLMRAKRMRENQDSWCHSVTEAQDHGDQERLVQLANSLESAGMTGPEALELESTVGVLRGTVGLHAHCYTSHDFESLLRISDEFDFHVQAFHHALEAWKVPNWLKGPRRNLTIATFANFGLYKKEAYDANLWAGKILAENGIPLAYKSDHGLQELSAKYLIFQAATAHSFHLEEEVALRSVTSVPARSLGIDHRVGHVKPGYDADIVIWNSHPLSLGATPIQVYIDGRDILDTEKVNKSLSKVEGSAQKPQMRTVLAAEEKAKQCDNINDSEIVITGINASLLPSLSVPSEKQNLTMVLRNGSIACFDSPSSCGPVEGGRMIQLKNGFISPGLTAFSSSLGLSDIFLEPGTGDGMVGPSFDATQPDNIIHAKYGVHFEGPAFGRARIAGITRAVTMPLSISFAPSFWGGSSVGFKISQDMNILNGGMFKEDVALHFAVQQSVKALSAMPTVSAAIGKLRNLLVNNLQKDNMYGLAANGSIPLVVSVDGKHEILQMIKMKQNIPSINLVILGGAEAPYVAKELAAEAIPVILQSFRGAPDAWDKKDVLTGPPLTESPVSVLQQAGVLMGLSITGLGDSHIHNLPLEAGWAGMYAGLSPKESINLVSLNIEKILGLEVQEENRDFVVYEGDPLQFGASVALAVDGDSKKIIECWPEAH